MALDAGTDVAVDANGDVTGGSGLKLAVFTALVVPVPDLPEAKAALRQALAGITNAVSQAVIDHIKANAVVTVTVHTTDSGLQRAGGTPTDGPTSDKVLSGTIA